MTPVPASAAYGDKYRDLREYLPLSRILLPLWLVNERGYYWGTEQRAD
jgi:hypothetical protein